MKRLILLILCGFCLGLLLGCKDKTTTDGSSLDNFDKSVAAIGKTLKGDKKAVFLDCAYRLISDDELLLYTRTLLGRDDATDSGIAEYISDYDNLTADEFLKAYIKDLELYIKVVDKTIAELKQKQTNSVEIVKASKQFEVVNAEFFIYKSTFLDIPKIKMTVKNNTKFVVSYAYFKGTVVTPGRTIPWFQGNFHHTFQGGVEIGETVSFEMSPAGLDWGSIPDRDDLEFKVETLKLEDEKGKVVLEAEFEEQDIHRISNCEEYIKAQTLKIKKIKSVLN